MASLTGLVAGFLFLLLGYANYTRPETMCRMYNWPLTAAGPVGENVRTTYRRRGYVFAAAGVLLAAVSLLVA